METPRPTPDQLGQIGLFGGLDSETLSTLAERLEVSMASPGQLLAREGDSAAEMFVVLNGELEVFKSRSDGHDVRVALFGPGDWFGDMSLLDVQPRSASVRAVAPTHLLHMKARDVRVHLYDRDIHAYAIFIMNLAREMSRRLRVANGILAQMMVGAASSIRP
jgi:CRP-like cAMP-binding protein